MICWRSRILLRSLDCSPERFERIPADGYPNESNSKSQLGPMSRNDLLPLLLAGASLERPNESVCLGLVSTRQEHPVHHPPQISGRSGVRCSPGYRALESPSRFLDSPDPESRANMFIARQRDDEYNARLSWSRENEGPKVSRLYLGRSHSNALTCR